MEKESDDEQMYAQIEFPQKKCSRVTDWQREGPWGVKSYLGSANIRSDKKELPAKKQAEVGDAGDQG